MKQLKLATLLLAGAVGLAACSDDGAVNPTAPDTPALAKNAASASGNTFVIMAPENAALPADLQAKIRAAGGTLKRATPEIGMAVAVSNDPQFAVRARRIAGIRSVTPDPEVQWIAPPMVANEQVPLETFASPPAPNDDFFYPLQWGLDAIDAPEAWNTSGEFGDAVRVCIIDSGIDADHPDLAPNLNTELSKSFVEGETPFSAPGFFFSHGTHVAGIAGAANNGYGIIGVAPEVELVSLRVFSDFGGGAPVSRINEAIVYAADIDCDIVNMSLSATFPKSRDYADELIYTQGRATNYAYLRGVTLIAAAGNDGLNRTQTHNLIVIPSELPHVVSVSAYGPNGWALNPTAPDPIFYLPAYYTNYGLRAIDVSAPGGNVDFDLLDSGQTCTIVLTRACWVFDLVFSTIADGWGWAAGTSMAAPHAAGVAALIIGRNGGEMNPDRVIEALERSAEDVGFPGRDPYFGVGSVNAYNAVTGPTRSR